MRVLLIGGAGFMGAPTARALLEAGHEVAVLSRGRRPVPAGAEALAADRRDPAALSAALADRRFDFTVDFVAYDDADVEGLLRVPCAALGRYVLISTGQVYLVTRQTDAVFREEDGDRPLTPEPPAGTADHAEWSYGVGKRRAEGALLSLRASHGVRGVILRLPIVQGEGDGSLRLWAWLERMLDGGPVLLPDGGRQPVRFVHAGDVTRAILHLLDHGPPRLAVYNLAQPDTLTLRAFLELAARAAGLTPRFVEVGWEELEAAGLDRSCAPYAGPWASVLDPARAAAEWGFACRRGDEYVAEVVRWHLEHRPEASHGGYAQRPRELVLADRLSAGRGLS
ncbi:MAG: NAD-dependent epimerase/dehydratase family protein [Candidatus Eisenbacteria bacterium]|nr:NAD-dependent epimerase/dehydratase family protein [Candidatus Eisenbacteria bacterium]